jgi:aminoglycoside phosphotransferase (APT) family kinase protein
MPPSWQPAHPVRRAHLEAVLARHRPHLPTTDLTLLGQGWDHAVWRCADLVLRYPHQAESLDLAARRAAPLAALARILPVAVPTPAFIAEPVLDHPGRCVAYQHLTGDIPAELPLTLADRQRAAAPLGHIPGRIRESALALEFALSD